MLATLVRDPFTDPAWLYEIKWDGYRIIANVRGKTVKLYSRGLQDYTGRYKVVADELGQMGLNAVVDGEMVVFDENGRPSFDLIQNYRPGQDIAYMVFDLLWLNGKSLMELPLEERKEKLAAILPKSEIIRFSESYDDGLVLFEKMKEFDFEGILAKKRDSIYRPGRRSDDWRKIQTVKQQEYVVGGWAESTSGRPFRTLIFGYYQDGKLMYQGHAGGGFKEKEMPGIYKRLKKLEVKKSPFANTQTVLDYTETPVHWVKPELVIQVKFATMTKSGMIRKPATFLGFREDKKAKDVILETAAVPPPGKPRTKQAPVAKKAKSTTSPNSNWPEIERQEITSSDIFNIDGHDVTITNVEKVLWKDEGITKADLIQYYHEVAPFILPHLQRRPLSLHIKHIAPSAPGLYIKDMEGRQPSWAEVFSTNRKHKKEGARDQIDYLVCNEESTLLWLVNLGCIDINPWTSTVANPEHPDFIIIDLDPSDEDFKKAIIAAQAAQDLFKSYQLKAWPKTSGKTGIHLYIPCAGFTFIQARSIAERICAAIHKSVPRVTTTAVSINSRGNKLYLDPNQNDYADTVAAPYSIRPYKLPTVSTPLEWKEIKPGLDPHGFTMKTIFKRLAKKGDLFLGTLDNEIRVLNSRRLLKLL
ncbi:MAG TPA: DNA ligase D [Chitinophagaceae bacterium]|nr:DNA ligase D [Chitinophagaceae bacterium]